MKRDLVILSIVSTLLLAGCGSSGAASPERSVLASAEKYIAAIKKDDYNTATKYTMQPDHVNNFIVPHVEVDKVFLAAILSKENDVVQSTTVAGDTATVRVKVTVPNLNYVPSAVEVQLLQEEVTQLEGNKGDSTFQRQLVEDVEKCPTYTEVVPLYMAKDAGVWKVATNNSKFEHAVLAADAPLPPDVIKKMKSK